MSNELQHNDLFNRNANVGINIDIYKVRSTLEAIKTLPETLHNSNVQKHSEVLDKLLEQIQRINFREYLNLPDDEDVKQKHIVVGIVKHLLETAINNKWNLCKTFDYTYIYNGAYWLQMDKEDIKQFLGKCAIQSGCAEYEARHYEFKDKLLKQFLTDAHLPQPEPNPDKICINLQNGTFEFTAIGWHLRPFNPDDFLTYQLPFTYNADAVCPLFNIYLHKVLPDEKSRMLLQEFSGYIFTNLNLEKMLMLTGTGANGKSVFFNILTALIGKQNVLTYSLGLFAHEYNRAKLTNVLLNYSSEKGTELNPDTFKALISSEPLQAREPYGKPFTLHNKAKFVINANELPKETESTEAYFRRWLIIPFDVTITEADKDTELANKIINTELTGVFNWLLQGLERIVRNKKFTECDKSNFALSEFKKQSDSVGLFLDEYNYTTSSNNKIALSDLYSSYKCFCNDDGYKAVGKNKFSTRLENKGYEKTRLNTGASAFYINKNNNY
jgi:putative DNA primase/helicase